MKSTAAASEKQIPENPQVLIKYNPEQALVILGHDSQAMLQKLRSVNIIGTKSLESASEVLHDATITAERLETFRASLVESVQRAAAKFRDIPGFDDFEVTLTIKRWSLRNLLTDGIQKIRGARAKFLSDEEDKKRRAQQEADAKQDAINRENAKKAAEVAKKAGASKETVATIKADVLATPAQLVESKALDKAKEAGASVRYDYYAAITNYEAFFQYAVTNPVIIQMLADQKIIEATEKAFRPMARAQKDKFSLPGMTFRKVPVDVARG